MQQKEIQKGLFITCDRSLWYEPEKTVIIADLHLGIESSLADQGTTVPRVQKELIIDGLSNIIDKYEPRTLVIAGDLKHEFGRNRKQEFREIYEVMDFLRERTSLVVIRGNHDNFLKTITNSAGIPFYERSLTIGDMTVSHGHLPIDKKGILVIGHEHPSIRIRDEMSATFKSSCFLYHDTGIIVLPAFTPLAYGRDILQAKGFISEPLKRIDPDEFQVCLVSDEGLMDLCTIHDIKKAMPDIY